MSAGTFDRRNRAQARAARAMRRAAERRGEVAPEERRSWIGVDLAKVPLAPRSRTLVPLIAVALVAALGVAALRIDLIRTRYALAANLEQEQTLLEDQRALIVRLRGLRDPSVLAALAQERGYRPAERVIALADPMPGPITTTDPTGVLPDARDFAAAVSGSALPAVSAGPPPALSAEGPARADEGARE
ncbi:MAG: hypothetical protein NXI30_25290 [bacterium]|nr:hypothetical protein [bacterium]